VSSGRAFRLASLREVCVGRAHEVLWDAFIPAEVPAMQLCALTGTLSSTGEDVSIYLQLPTAEVAHALFTGLSALLAAAGLGVAEVGGYVASSAADIAARLTAEPHALRVVDPRSVDASGRVPGAAAASATGASAAAALTPRSPPSMQRTPTIASPGVLSSTIPVDHEVSLSHSHSSLPGLHADGTLNARRLSFSATPHTRTPTQVHHAPRSPRSTSLVSHPSLLGAAHFSGDIDGAGDDADSSAVQVDDSLFAQGEVEYSTTQSRVDSRVDSTAPGSRYY
jgi:hypothetical protein